MDIVIKSLLNKSTEDFTQYIYSITEPDLKELISPQEENLFLFLKESLVNSGQLPSEDYVVGKFPEYKVPLSKAKELSASDLKVHYCNLLKKRANLQASKMLMTMASEVSQKGFDYDMLDKLRSFASIADDTDDIVDNTESENSFRTFYNVKKSQPTGMKTFINEIDKRITGIPPGYLAVLMGFVSSFKTTLGVNIVYNNAKKLNYNICYISLEVPKEDILAYLLTRHSFESKFTTMPFVKHEKVRLATMTEEEENFIFDEVAPDYYATGGKIKILDETDFKTFSKGEIREKLYQVDDEFMKETGYGLDGFIVDHVNLCKFSGTGGKKKSSSEGSEINEYVSFFRKLALSFRRDATTKQMRKLVAFLLAQTNRDGWAKAVKNKGAYNLRALSEANELERAAQLVISIFTDEDLKMSHEALVQVLKNRNGANLVEPSSIFVDPEAYVAGEEMEGFNDMVSMGDFDTVFSGESAVDFL